MAPRKGWHSATLTEEEVLEIIRHSDDGATAPELAFEYGVSSKSIYRIKSGQRWGTLTGRGTDKRSGRQKDSEECR